MLHLLSLFQKSKNLGHQRTHRHTSIYKNLCLLKIQILPLCLRHLCSVSGIIVHILSLSTKHSQLMIYLKPDSAFYLMVLKKSGTVDSNYFPWSPFKLYQILLHSVHTRDLKKSWLVPSLSSLFSQTFSFQSSLKPQMFCSICHETKLPSLPSCNLIPWSFSHTAHWGF